MLAAHGIVPASAEVDAGEHGVQLVASGGLAVLVTESAGPAERPRRADLVRHSEVLQHAVAATSVLPLRFGTLFESREALVEELLEDRRGELAELMRELEGKVELSFAATLREEAVLREAVAADPEIAALREATRDRTEEQSYPERMRLGELVTARLAERRDELEQRFLDTVAPHVAATLLPDEPPSPTTIRASLLVAREAVAPLEEALEGLARDEAERLEARLLGPLPPYSFVGGSAQEHVG